MCVRVNPEGELKLVILMTLFMFSACAQPGQHANDSPESIVPVDSASVVQGQLMLEFDQHISLQQARHAVAACASASSVIRQHPVMLLVSLRTTQNSKQAAHQCSHLPGVVRAEWNQKRHLR